MKNNSKYNKEFGNKGEKIAAEFLEKKGFEIIEKNFKFGREGEIDIIAKDNNILVFIEVKTRTNHKFGKPIQQISYKKQLSWRRAAEGFMFKKNIINQECRLDLLAIDFTNDKIEIEYIENAF
jgi:putative endonuclease